MIEVSVSVAISASAERVWSIMGGFDFLPRWLNMVSSSDLSDGGRVRRLVTSNGATIVERLLEFSQSEYRYSYAHLDSPDPVSGYVGVMSVRDEEGGAVATWSSSFDPIGISPTEAVARYETVYREGLAALKQLIEQG